ncbi:MAG: Pvc16 family protein [Burkholderiaceae bacterium]|nr:Pvc16 family protein [Burkholderiaceae bacterium]
MDTPPDSSTLLPALALRLVKLLEPAVAGGPAHSPGVRLTTPRELAHGSSEGLTLTLVGVREVAALRNALPGPSGARVRPTLAIEAHYLVTAWATQSVVQQWLLASALRQLHRHPVLAGSDLAHPFEPGTTLDLPADTACRLLPRFPDAAETAAIAAVLGVETLPASFVVVGGPLVLD